jgi:hypothetical protein
MNRLPKTITTTLALALTLLLNGSAKAQSGPGGLGQLNGTVTGTAPGCVKVLCSTQPVVWPTFTVPPAAAVTLNGVPCTVNQVPPGAVVSIVFSRQGPFLVAVQVVAVK